LGWNPSSLDVEFTPPAGADSGAPLEVDFALDFSGLVVIGRYVDASGEMVPGVELNAFYSTRTERGNLGRRGPVPMVADDEGRFAHYLGTMSLREDSGRVVEAWVSMQGEGDPRRGESVHFDPHVPSGVLDVGDVLLAEPPLQFAGVVVDDEGEPVEGALVVAEAVVHTSQNQGLTPRLVGVSSPRTRTDPAGHFELRFDTPLREFYLQVTCAGYVPGPPQSFATGATELRLELVRAGSLVGTVARASNRGWFVDLELLEPALSGALLPERLPNLKQPGASGLFLRETRQPLRAGARFGWSGLPPGRYRVFLTYNNLPGPLLDLDDLIVTADEELTDERLVGLDLDALLPTIHLDLFGPEGKRLPSSAQGVLGLRGATAIQGQGRFFGSRTSVSAPELPVDFVLDVIGYRRATLMGVTMDTEVHLESAPLFLFRLPEGVAAPEGWTLRLILEPKGALPWKSAERFLPDGSIVGAPNGLFGRRPSWLGDYTASLAANKDTYFTPVTSAVLIPGVFPCTDSFADDPRDLEVTQAAIDALCTLPQ
jgi:hypothetical protein